MSAKELISYMLAPAGIVAAMCDNFGYHFPSFTGAETCSLLAGLVMGLGWLWYLYDKRVKSETARKKALAKAEYERLKEEQARKEAERLAEEEFQYRWARLGPKMEIWRSEITGAGRNPKEGWL